MTPNLGVTGFGLPGGHVKASMAIGVLLRAAVCCCFVSEQRCAAVLLRPAVCCCFVPEQRCAAVRLRAAVCFYFVLERLCAAVLLRAVMGVLYARVVPRSSRPFFFLPSERVHEYPKPPAICPAQACRTSEAACDFLISTHCVPSTPSLRPFARLRRVAQAEPLAIPDIHSLRPKTVANSVCPSSLVFNSTRLQLDVPKCDSDRNRKP